MTFSQTKTSMPAQPIKPEPSPWQTLGEDKESVEAQIESIWIAIAVLAVVICIGLSALGAIVLGL